MEKQGLVLRPMGSSRGRARRALTTPGGRRVRTLGRLLGRTCVSTCQKRGYVPAQAVGGGVGGREHVPAHMGQVECTCRKNLYRTSERRLRMEAGGPVSQSARKVVTEDPKTRQCGHFCRQTPLPHVLDYSTHTAMGACQEQEVIM